MTSLLTQVRYIQNIEQMLFNINRFDRFVSISDLASRTFPMVRQWYIDNNTGNIAPARFISIIDMTLHQYLDTKLQTSSRGAKVISKIIKNNLNVNVKQTLSLDNILSDFCKKHDSSSGFSTTITSIIFNKKITVDDVDQTRFEEIYKGLLTAVKSLPKDWQIRMKDALSD